MGISSVADINRHAPSGHRPDDFLPGARSVIVFVGRPTTQGAWRSPDHRTLTANMDFFRIRGSIALAVAKLIEEQYGYYSLADVPPPIGLNTSLSFKLCAEMAGLGTRSMAGGVILNRELGLLNLSVCVTAMPLKADGSLREPVCPAPSCVKMWEKHGTTPCLKACPMCLSGELEDRRIKWMRFDRRICSTRAQNLSDNSLLRVLRDSINEPDPEVRRTMLLGSFSRNAIEMVSYGVVISNCFECVRNCPVGIKGRTLKPGKCGIGDH
ncbi:hypothetical protein ACFLWZ_03550 [Chloroflexota bacterium]